MHAKTLLILVALLHIMPSPKSFAADTRKSNEQRVRDYVAAFNEQNIDSMLSMVTEDIQWLSVAGDKITVETKGMLKLRESMAAYFKSTKAKAELE
ncbi:MAG: nuclear transport factor 2 family protein [Acidobacteriota bacterium]|nr:nuclear transport factor 2 family protein [Acidobacteriota bacterium]